MNRRWIGAVTVFLIPVLLVVGCAHPRSKQAHPPAKVPFPVEQYYETPPLSGPVRIVLVKKSPTYLWQKVILPKTSSSIDGKNQVTLDYFLPVGKGPFPLILVSPILGGKYRLERFLGVFLAKRGFAVLIVRRKQLRLLPDEGLDQIEEYLRTSVIRLRMALDWAETRSEIDPSRIGSLGISLGGILNVVLAGVDPRVKVNAIALAGGDLADVICYTHVKAIRRYRNQFMKRQGLTVEGLKKRLRETLRTDPMRFAHRVHPDQTLFFIAWFDLVIGRKHCRKLAKALRDPKTYYFPFGHYSSILMIPFVRIRALHFFEEKFKTVPPDANTKAGFRRQASSPRHKRSKARDRRREHSADWRRRQTLSQSDRPPPA